MLFYILSHYILFLTKERLSFHIVEAQALFIVNINN